MRLLALPAPRAAVAVIAAATLTLIHPCCAVAQAAPITLHALVEQAWQRSPAVQTLLARQDEAAAGSAVAQSWLAATPTLGLSQRGGDGRESEVALAAPLLLPRQRATRRVHAARGAAATLARLQDERLAVAGEVRTRLWQAIAEREAMAEQVDHLHHLGDLRDEVARRVVAGDLARSDGLLAQQELLAAQSEAALARGQAATALARFALLTGSTVLPPAQPEPLADALQQDASQMQTQVPSKSGSEPEPEPESALQPRSRIQPRPQHIRLQAAELAEQHARAAVDLAAGGAHGAPTVALSLRRERTGMPATGERSIGIAVQVPFGGALRNRPAQAQAATALATASAQLALAVAELDIELPLAREQLGHAVAALTSAQARLDAMREHTALFEKAFAQGERGVAELLRSRALTHEAQVAVRRQQAAVGLAHAQLNQAYGLLP